MSEALTTWTRGWYLCIEFKMVCIIMVMMTSIDHDGDEGVDRSHCHLEVLGALGV